MMVLNNKVRKLAMIAGLRFALVLSLVGSGSAEAGGAYNVRATPSSPTVSEPFQVLFDGGFCATFVLPPNGSAPTVALTNETLRVTVDFFEFVSCDQVPQTFSITAPGLLAGNYQLELVGRNSGLPNDLLTLDSSPLQVVSQGGSSGAAPATIPTLGIFALMTLAASLVLSLRPFTQEVGK